MASVFESELESELEEELHELHESGFGESEAGLEGELGSILGGLFGEGELHEQHEQHEAHEQHEMHEMHEFELEEEYESGEQFFGKVFRGIGSFVKKAAPILKSVAKVAAPLVGNAILPGIGGVLGNMAASALGDGEYESEFELHESHELHELHEMHEEEFEIEGESESEVAHEIVSHELTQHEALAEMIAESAAHEQHEGEAEAMIGAATMTVINPADRRALRAMLPHLIKGTAVLARILRRRRTTRPAVRAIPTIVQRTIKTLKRNAAAGRPITRRAVAQATASQVRKVLGSPKICTAAIAKNVKASRVVKRRSSARPVRG